MHIVSKGTYAPRERNGKVKCPTCHTIFEYEEKDVQYCSINTWGNYQFLYVICLICTSRLLIKDYRWIIWRLLDPASLSGYKKPKFVK